MAPEHSMPGHNHGPPSGGHGGHDGHGDHGSMHHMMMMTVSKWAFDF